MGRSNTSCGVARGWHSPQYCSAQRLGPGAGVSTRLPADSAVFRTREAVRGRPPRGAQGPARAALPASPRGAAQVSHVAPAPGAPLTGLQRPLARAARAGASSQLATPVPRSRRPRAPGPASGQGGSASDSLCVPGRAAGRPPAVRVPSEASARRVVGWAASRALFGIVGAYLSAAAEPERPSGQSVSREERTWRPPPRGSPPAAPGEPARVLGRGRAAGSRAPFGRGRRSAELRGADRR